MWSSEDEEGREFMVVVNQELQYSIWPKARSIPLGWRAVEVSGRKDECLRYIDEVWTDLRPLSLREQMDAGSTKPGNT
jgi:MbtH protein